MSETVAVSETEMKTGKSPVLERKVPLEFPLTLDGGEVREVVMRRPKVGDQLAAQRGGGEAAEQEVRLFSRLTRIPVEDFEAMDLKDYRKLQEAFTSFLS